MSTRRRCDMKRQPKKPGPRIPLAALAVLTALAPLGCEQPVVETVEVVRPVKMMTLGAEEGGGTLEFPGSIEALLTASAAFVSKVFRRCSASSPRFQ